MARTIRSLLVVAAMLAFPAVGSPADLVLVAHPSVGVDSIARSQVARFFLRQATTWPGGEHVKPVDQVRTTAVREEFTREVLRRTLSEIETFWTQAIFSGRAVPPPQKKNDDEVLAYVRDTPGAIGYVSSSAALDKVKRLSIEPD